MNNPMEEAKRICVYVGFASTEGDEYPRYLISCHEEDGAGQLPAEGCGGGGVGGSEDETILFPMLVLMMIVHYYKITDPEYS